MFKKNKRLLIIFLIGGAILIGSTYSAMTPHFYFNNATATDLLSFPSIEALFPSLKTKNKDILSGYVNTNNVQLYANIIQSVGELELANDDYYSISKKDYNYLKSNSKQAFPYQRFKFHVNEVQSSMTSLNVAWQGQSNRLVDLYGWSYPENQWTLLPRTISRDDNNLDITGTLDVTKMVKDKTAEIMVAPSTKNEVLKGKIPSKDEYDFTFAWISDTQYYAAAYPDIYNKMTKYIADSRKDKKIVYAIHTGDVVDNMDDGSQWKSADQSMKILEKAGIPYGVLAGNHDVGNTPPNYTEFNKYFGEKRFANMPTFGGSPNNNRDHYDLVSAGGKDYIILYLGWGIQADNIAWANETLLKYRDRKAILCLHGYISGKGSYVDVGSEVYTKIASQNKNLMMVLCGHFGGSVVNIKRDNDKVLYEILSDYQFNPEGGAGYMKLLHFDSKNDLVYVNTYSPYKDDYNYYEDIKDQFILPLTAEKGEIRLDTDYVNIEH